MSTPIENLRQVHRLCVVPCFDHSLVGDRAHCLTCAVTWPCDVIAALDALEEGLHQLLDARPSRGQLMARLDTLEAENARLREAIGLATTAVPTMEMDAADPVGMMQRVVAEIDTLREQVEALATALRNQGLLQNTFHGKVWHIYDCPASFDFSECNYRCRVAREAFALVGTEPYVSQETRRDTEVYE